MQLKAQINKKISEGKEWPGESLTSKSPKGTKYNIYLRITINEAPATELDGELPKKKIFF